MTESNNIHRLTHDGKEIILVGTAHVSRESADLVRTTIESEKPDTVCVELCESRWQSIQQKSRWRDMDIVKVVKEKKAFLLLSNLILASFQRRIADKMDIQPGQEMLTAIDTAKAVGARTWLADRDIRTTLSRTWRSMTLWGRVKLLFQLLLSLGEVDDLKEEDIERMKQEDVLNSLLNEIGASQPVIREILIDERDRYLMQRIKSAPGEKIVAVVGAGHVPGIRNYWEREFDLADLEVMPPKSSLSGSLKWIIPVAIMLLFAWGFYAGGSQAGSDMILWWVAANGLLAGIGAIVAWGHPLTVLSSVLSAPLTSLNPMIAAGWVSGLVEAFSRKPKVRDFETLQDDIRSVRGFWSNKVTRILLVVVFTNLGSTLGTFIAFPMIVRVLQTV
ncbi:MAG: TraB/GumN family protein [Desulfobacterales bacterium]|nr:TraB/GumN family protein [Desulfobacterales bacterium]MDJ0875088.1 TraB/GumN family protein [Desulfobacterales bacterium]MDJ0884758.1 TraB/GumN family protein [Desulfobacterales bacterium]